MPRLLIPCPPRPCRPIPRRPNTLGRRSFIFPNLSRAGSSGNDDVQTFHERKILPYDQKQLYDLVADVGSYHRFIPYCVASRVLSGPSKIEGSNETESEAELTVGFMGLEESYVSRVVCTPFDKVTATATSQIPLFKSLTTTWSFTHASPASPHPSASTAPLPSHSETAADLQPETLAGPTLLSIDLAYAFSNPLHAAVAAAFFEKVSSKMIEAFERRCMEVYGPGKR